MIVIRPDPQSFPLTVLDMETLALPPASLLAPVPTSVVHQSQYCPPASPPARSRLPLYAGPRLLAYQLAVEAARRDMEEAPAMVASSPARSPGASHASAEEAEAPSQRSLHGQLGKMVGKTWIPIGSTLHEAVNMGNIGAVQAELAAVRHM